ncbi:Dihydroxy-acid dehydratase [Bienertia sinuspersici]
MGSRNEAAPSSSSGQWNECAVKTVLSFSEMDFPTTSNSAVGHKEGSRVGDMVDIRAAIKEQVDEVGRSLYLAKLHGISDKNLDYSGLTVVSESQKEDYPRLPPVRLKSEDKSLSANWEERFDNDGSCLKLSSADGTYLLGSYLDVPVGQEIGSSGAKRMTGGNWLSVSRV